jgi:membrane protein YdbS with pleckstrin-like domain
MGFPTKMLNPGEQVFVDVRPHWKYLFAPILAVAVALGGSIAALVAQVPRWAEYVLGVVLVVCLVWLAGRYLRWATTSFVTTNERLVIRKGVIRRQGREILLDRITDISYSQSLGDRILRCGDVMLESPGRDSPEVFPDLPRPVGIQNEIYRLINERRIGPPAGGPALAGAGGWEPPPGPDGGAGPQLAGAPGTAGAGRPAGGVGPGGTLVAPMVSGEPGGGAGGAAGTAGAGAGAAGTTVAGTGAGPGPSLAEQLSQLGDLRKRHVISRREFAAKKAEILSRM